MVCPGLYVDPTDQWVVTRDGDMYWTIRKLEGWGLSLSGGMFPDYGDITYGEYFTLTECKFSVAKMIARAES